MMCGADEGGSPCVLLSAVSLLRCCYRTAAHAQSAAPSEKRLARKRKGGGTKEVVTGRKAQTDGWFKDCKQGWGTAGTAYEPRGTMARHLPGAGGRSASKFMTMGPKQPEETRKVEIVGFHGLGRASHFPWNNDSALPKPGGGGRQFWDSGVFWRTGCEGWKRPPKKRRARGAMVEELKLGPRANHRSYSPPPLRPRRPPVGKSIPSPTSETSGGLFLKKLDPEEAQERHATTSSTDSQT